MQLCLIVAFKTDQDAEEKNVYHEVKVYNQTPPIYLQNPQPLASVGFESHLISGGNSGGLPFIYQSPTERIKFQKTLALPKEGEVIIEKAVYIHISDKVNRKFMEGVGPHFGKTNLFATKIRNAR